MLGKHHEMTDWEWQFLKKVLPPIGRALYSRMAERS